MEIMHIMLAGLASSETRDAARHFSTVRLAPKPSLCSLWPAPSVYLLQELSSQPPQLRVVPLRRSPLAR
jgi:hypothetical protein